MGRHHWTDNYKPSKPSQQHNYHKQEYYKNQGLQQPREAGPRESTSDRNYRPYSEHRDSRWGALPLQRHRPYNSNKNSGAPQAQWPPPPHEFRKFLPINNQRSNHHGRPPPPPSQHNRHETRPFHEHSHHQHSNHPHHNRGAISKPHHQNQKPPHKPSFETLDAPLTCCYGGLLLSAEPCCPEVMDIDIPPKIEAACARIQNGWGREEDFSAVHGFVREMYGVV